MNYAISSLPQPEAELEVRQNDSYVGVVELPQPEEAEGSQQRVPRATATAAEIVALRSEPRRLPDNSKRYVLAVQRHRPRQEPRCMASKEAAPEEGDISAALCKHAAKYLQIEQSHSCALETKANGVSQYSAM